MQPRPTPCLAALCLVAALAAALTVGGCDSDAAICDNVARSWCEDETLHVCTFDDGAHAPLTGGWRHFTTACADVGGVCAAAGDEAACVAPALLPCAAEEERCSADGRRRHECEWQVGLASAQTWACAEDERCVEEDGEAICRLTAAPACTDDARRCSDDGREVLGCRGDHPVRVQTCEADAEVCVESGDAAHCVAAPATPCERVDEGGCSDDGRTLLACDAETRHLAVERACGEGEVCAVSGGAADCVQAELTPCEPADGHGLSCSEDTTELRYCSRAGFVAATRCLVGVCLADARGARCSME